MNQNTNTAVVSENRVTEFTKLKEQRYTLNMQIRLAMEIHDEKTQGELEEKMTKVLERMKHVGL